jgi:ketosteroid isomerase-like protein
MSQENVEVVRRTIDSFNTSEIDRVLGGVGDDFEFDWSNSIGPLKGIDRGREETLKLASPSATRGTHYGGNPKEIIDVDEARVIVVNHVRMRGRDSGVAVDATSAQLWTLRSGTVQRVKLYQSKADALEAIGLRE